MAQTFELKATKREITKKSARDTRAQARVPGVVYGKGFESVPVSVDYSDLLRTYRKSGGASIVNLDVEGKEVKVLIKTLALDPVSDDMTHVDFLALNLKEQTIVKVPLIFVGESPAVKNYGGIFMHNIESLEIRCLPMDIPHDIKVDISGLEEIHDHVCVKDLGIDESKLELMHIDSETVVCTVTGRAAEVEETQTESEEISAEVPSDQGGGDEEAGE